MKNIINKTLGILGGGQLGKMIAAEASRLGIKTCIFDPNKNAPAFQNANIIVNSDYTNKTSCRVDQGEGGQFGMLAKGGNLHNS